MKKIVIFGLIALTLLNANDLEIECKSPIQTFSNPEKMAKSDFSANVLWKDVKLESTSIGYGPAANKEYELTINDGIVYMARPGLNDDVILRTDPKPTEGAFMLQVVTPKNWTLYSQMENIQSFEGLNFELDDILQSGNCGEDMLVPFKVKGKAKSITWSMDTDNHKIITNKDVDVEIVGIYNLNAKSKYYMVKGFSIHAHVLIPSLKYAGHIRDIELESDANLYLPIKK